MSQNCTCVNSRLFPHRVEKCPLVMVNNSPPSLPSPPPANSKIKASKRRDAVREAVGTECSAFERQLNEKPSDGIEVVDRAAGSNQSTRREVNSQEGYQKQRENDQRQGDQREQDGQLEQQLQVRQAALEAEVIRLKKEVERLRMSQEAALAKQAHQQRISEATRQETLRQEAARATAALKLEREQHERTRQEAYAADQARDTHDVMDRLAQLQMEDTERTRLHEEQVLFEANLQRAAQLAQEHSVGVSSDAHEQESAATSASATALFGTFTAAEENGPNLATKGSTEQLLDDALTTSNKLLEDFTCKPAVVPWLCTSANSAAAIDRVSQNQFLDKQVLDSQRQAAQKHVAIAVLHDSVDMMAIFEKRATANEDPEADRVNLCTAMGNVVDLDMPIDVVARAKTHVKDPEDTQGEVFTAPAGPSLQNAGQPYVAAEEARQMRQEIAKQARFDVKNYPHLRTTDDSVHNKTKIKVNFLSFQRMIIPESLTCLNCDDNKLALQTHEDLLGYMGDKGAPSPVRLALDILLRGYDYKPIRDEIYMLIIKQLSNNPRPESSARGWQIMCMCVGTFPPSPEFENFLLHFILEKHDRARGSIIDYAKYCLCTLEALLNSGNDTGFVPCVEEILAYQERPPILATIYLVDGNVITENLCITPNINVAKVLDMCTGWLDLRDTRINTLGMFVYDLGELEDPNDPAETGSKAAYSDLKRTPRPLRNEDYMGDIIVQKARQRRKFKFVLKRKLFLPNYNYRGEDPFFERMTYLQAEDEVIIQGNLEVLTVDVAQQLAAISMAVAFGEEMPDSVEAMVAANVDDFVPPYWRTTKSSEEWAAQILALRDSLIFVDPDDLQDRFLQIVQECPAYGSHWFYSHKMEIPTSVSVPQSIRQLPNDVLLAFNADGIHLYTFSRKLLMSFPYGDICRWGGSSSQFSLIMADDQIGESYEFVLVTSQAADMAAIILDYIRAIVAEKELEA